MTRVVPLPPRLARYEELPHVDAVGCPLITVDRPVLVEDVADWVPVVEEDRALKGAVFEPTPESLRSGIDRQRRGPLILVELDIPLSNLRVQE